MKTNDMTVTIKIEVEENFATTKVIRLFGIKIYDKIVSVLK